MMRVSLAAIRQARSDLIAQECTPQTIAGEELLAGHHLQHIGLCRKHTRLCRDLLAQLCLEDRLKVLAHFENNPDPYLFPSHEWQIRVCREEIVHLTIWKEKTSPFKAELSEEWLPTISNKSCDFDTHAIAGPVSHLPAHKALAMILASFCSLLAVESDENESSEAKDAHRKLHLQICQTSLALVAANDRRNSYRLKLMPSDLLVWHHYHCLLIIEKLASPLCEYFLDLES